MVVFWYMHCPAMAPIIQTFQHIAFAMASAFASQLEDGFGRDVVKGFPTMSHEL